MCWSHCPADTMLSCWDKVCVCVCVCESLIVCCCVEVVTIVIVIIIVIINWCRQFPVRLRVTSLVDRFVFKLMSLLLISSVVSWCFVCNGSTLVAVNIVAHYRAQLVLRWLTYAGLSSVCTTLVFNQLSDVTQPGHPSVGRCSVYQQNAGE